MIKNVIEVPTGIRYMSQWEEFREIFPRFPHIMDKQIPGCGFTEWCLTSPENVILCSPRNMLILNKWEQHPGDVFRVHNSVYDVDPEVDKDLSDKRGKKSESSVENGIDGITETREDDEKLKIWRAKMEEALQRVHKEEKAFIETLKRELEGYIRDMDNQGRPLKILVTYDSFRLLKDALEFLGIFETFQIVVDEFQSIFVDSKFKSQTEMEFVTTLHGVQKVCYLSATPMMGEYLAMIPEFKDLPYYELDWKALDPGRVCKPELKVRIIDSIYEPAKKIIEKYKAGEYEQTYIKDSGTGETKVIESREAMIFVNSVSNIINIIDRTDLRPEEVNILCANTPDNLRKIQKKLGREWTIGKVPLKEEPRKMFTLCTRTVYLGADFYSDNARTFILSDANVNCLAVDVSLDLPQIMGRQRLEDNPWKNSAEFYYKGLKKKGKMTREEFDEIVKYKSENTESLLRAWNDIKLGIDKHRISEMFIDNIKAYNYEKNYLAVNQHAGSDLVPTTNHLVMIAERRAFDIQQIDYADRFSVFNAIEGALGNTIINPEVEAFFERYDRLGATRDKLRLFCESDLSSEARDIIYGSLDVKVKKYLSLDPSRLKACGYETYYLDQELEIANGDIKTKICRTVYEVFKPGDRVSRADIKETLRNIYQSLNYPKTPKAVDIENWFEVSDAMVLDSFGKRQRGFELGHKKFTLLDEI